jgi:hypothetical protein
LIKRQGRQFHKQRTWLWAGSILFLFGCSPSAREVDAAKVTNVGQKQDVSERKKHAALEKAESEQSETAKTDDEVSALGAKVLDHSKYVGKVKMGYMAAQRAPDVCQKLFCYCGCDYTDEHGSLLDCFTSDHGVDCIYCQGEAVLAYKMKRKGASIEDIQKAVDLNWGPHYPFHEQPSETIKKYWKTRAWAPGDAPTAEEKHDEGKAITDPFTGSQDKNSKPMGKPNGDCCGGKKGSKQKEQTKFAK